METIVTCSRNISKQDKVLNEPRDIKILKIAKSGIINHIISRYGKLLQKLSHALLPWCITKLFISMKELLQIA